MECRKSGYVMMMIMMMIEYRIKPDIKIIFSIMRYVNCVSFRHVTGRIGLGKRAFRVGFVVDKVTKG